MKRIVGLAVIGLVVVVGMFGNTTENVEAARNPAIYMITGSQFIDANKDGVYNLRDYDMPIKNQQVEAYRSLEDAKQSINMVASRKTSAVGTYSFSKLSKGTYYLKYGLENGVRAIEQTQTALDENGEPIIGIIKVDLGKRFVTNVNLAVVKTTSMKFHVFNDVNGNSLMDSTESIENYRTMIIINLENTLKMIESGEFDSLDVDELVKKAPSGSLDIGENAIMLRTTKGKKPTELTDVENGIYVAIRSPFNLSILGGLLGDVSRIEALLDIIGGGDISALLENPDLISTNDITTTEDLAYIKSLANFFPQAFDQVEALNLGKYLGENVGNNTNKLLNQGRGLVNLVNNVPNMKFITVDIWNNIYETKAFAVEKRSDFYIGIKRYATTTGYVFNDRNGNGKKDFGEGGIADVEVRLHNQEGEIIQTIISGKTGQYRFTPINYDETMYLTVDTEKEVTTLYTGEVPVLLQDNHVITSIMLPFTEANYQVSQNIGLLP